MRAEKAGGDIGSLLNDAPQRSSTVMETPHSGGLLLALGEILAGHASAPQVPVVSDT